MVSLQQLGLVACLVTLTLGFPFPPSQEVKFSYHADVEVRTDFPSSAISQFTLHGVLKVQAASDQAVLQLTDLKTSIYNGAVTMENTVHESQIPEGAGDLALPFKLHFKEGVVVGLQGDAVEPEWSLNIKRALASVLHLETQNLDMPAFTAKENGLYGSCDVEYAVNHQDESYIVQKTIDHSACSNFPTTTWSNVPPVPIFCPSGNDELITSSSERIYVLNSNRKIKSIVSSAGIYNQPLKARGELQYILVNQTLKYISEGDISTPLSSNLGPMTDLTYRLPGKEYSQGRSPLKQATGLKILKRMLTEISESLEVPPTRKADKLHNERITHAIYFIMALELATLENYFDELSGDTSYGQETLRKLFLQLLPRVGTSDSTLLICDLISQGRISNEDEGRQLLMKLPFFVREPSEEILQQCEVISTLPIEKGVGLQQAGVLSFATLIHKVCKQHCSPETQESYVRKYLDRFVGAVDYSTKMLYLEGLSNIEDGKVFEYLEPVIKTNPNNHLRFLSVWATMNVAPYHPDQVHKLYWPILTNVNEPLEMRVAAFTMLVVSKPPTGRFVSLHWFMSREKDPRLRHFYYTTLQSLVNTKDPCYSLMSMFAARVLRLLPPPSARHWATGNYILDQADEHRGYGGMAQLFLIGDNRTELPSIFYLRLSGFGMGMQLHHVSVYLKLTGVARAVKDRLMRIDPNTLKIKQLADILRDIKTSPTSNEEVHVEMLLKSQDRVITSLHFNESTFHKAADILSQVTKAAFDVHHNIHHLDSMFLYERTIPTDFGIPAFSFFSTTGLSSLRGNDTQQVADSHLVIQKQLELRRTRTAVGRLEIYNPIMHLWHGVKRSTVLQILLPINGRLRIDTNAHCLKFNIVRQPDEFQGLITHMHSNVFVIGEESTKKLQVHCQSCQKNFAVTKGNQYKHKDTFLDVDIKDLGVKLQGEVFDCEHHITLQTLEFATKQQNYHVFPLSRPFVALSHVLDSWLVFSPPGSCGTEIRLLNLDNHTTELEGLLQLSSIDQKTMLTASLIQKSGVKTQYRWHLNASSQKDPVLLNVAVNIMRDASAIENFRKMCLNVNMEFPAAPSNKYLIQPSKPITADISMNWAIEGGEGMCGGEPAKKLPFHIRIIAETTPEQERMAAAADVWPFNACKIDNDTIACHRAAYELATLRKYSLVLNHTEPIVPELFDLMSFARTSDGNLVVSADVSPVNPVMYLTLGSENFRADAPRYWLDPLLLNTQYPMVNQIAMALGLIKPE